MREVQPVVSLAMEAVDRSRIRVKAMLIALNDQGTAHAVSVNAPTAENPDGYHRFIGGSVELGETHRDAVLREVREELGASVADLVYLGCIENIFRINGALGHEIVFLYTGQLDPAPSPTGATLTEIDGSVLPIEWRNVAIDQTRSIPLYPAAAESFVHEAAAIRHASHR